jgi:hypothetical protein
MAKKIPEKVKEEIVRLYDNGNGLNPRQISERIDVSYSSVYKLTRLKQRMNPFTLKLFESDEEYKEFFAHTNGFESYKEYEEYRARTNGFRSRASYNRAIEKGRKLKIKNEKRRQKEEKKKIMKQNLGDLILKRLEELGKNKTWLAREVGVTREAISKYSRGIYLPGDEDILRNLFSALDVNYKSLEELL